MNYLKKAKEWIRSNPDDFDRLISDVVIITAFVIIAIMAIYASQLA